MPYDYETELPNVTDEMVLRTALAARRLIRSAGAVTMEVLMPLTGADLDWTRVATVERLLKLGYLHERSGTGCPTQARIFVAANALADD